MPPSRAPAYAYLVPLLTSAARSVGYALAVHGSMARDLDLVAVPWTEEAQDADALISALLASCGFTTSDPNRPAISSGPTAKPHGRTSWTIPLDGGCYIDLSVTPRTVTPAPRKPA